MRRMVWMVILGLALILPGVAASQQRTGNVAATTSSPVPLCAADGSRQPIAVNTEPLWRLRAYEDLDCALAILDEALEAQGSVITLSRQKAEWARASVWSARDAAARIGR